MRQLYLMFGDLGFCPSDFLVKLAPMISTQTLRKLAIFGVFLFAAFSVQAEPEGSLTDFRLGLMGIKSDSRGSDPAAFDIHWSPVLSYEGLSVRADIGLNVVSFESKDQFSIFGYEVFIGQAIQSNVYFELGGGFQNWLEHGGLTPVVSSHVMWALDQESKLIKGFYLGGSKTFGDQASWQGRFGLQIRVE